MRYHTPNSITIPGVTIQDFPDPFSIDDNNRYTRILHFTNQKPNFSSLDKAALLSRYSRTKHDAEHLIKTEFQDTNRSNDFIEKLLLQYGDDSIAELASETVGVEGISALGAAKLTDRRIGISFLEKSTRYVPFTEDSFYIPAEMYQLGLVDEYKALCSLSFHTFQKIYSELEKTFQEKHPIFTCMFFDSKKEIETVFENLELEYDIKNAENAYKRAVKDKCFDVAGYSWLTSIKTNIGFNANARAIEYLIGKTKQSSLSELQDFSFNLFSILKPSIYPFIKRTERIEQGYHNPFEIYTPDSLSGVYIHNVATMLRSFDNFSNSIQLSGDQDLEEEQEQQFRFSEAGGGGSLEQPMKSPSSSSSSSSVHNQQPSSSSSSQPNSSNNTKMSAKAILLSNLINGLMPNKYKYQEAETNTTIQTEPRLFEPNVTLVQFMEEWRAVDTICTAIMFENLEILQEHDEKQVLNIDPHLRIVGADTEKIQSSILYDMLNNHKNVREIIDNDSITSNRVTENTLTFENIQEYWTANRDVNDTPAYQNYKDPDIFTITKDQHYLLNKYIGNRDSRRKKLGRAFEMIDYLFQISSSFRIMREAKRHRLASSIYPEVVTARNSFDSFIFPLSIIQNQELFEAYKHLIEECYKLYTKVAKKDYMAAQYCLPLATRCEYLMKMNFRELDHFLSLRTTPQAHPEIRSIAQGMYDLIYTIHPNLGKLLKFVDKENYNLGRIKSEYYRQRKIKK